MSASGDEKRVEFVVAETENSVQIRFQRLAGLTEELLKTFPSDREKNLLAVLGADLTAEPEGAKVVVRLSKNIDRNHYADRTRNRGNGHRRDEAWRL